MDFSLLGLGGGAREDEMQRYDSEEETCEGILILTFVGF